MYLTYHVQPHSCQVDYRFLGMVNPSHVHGVGHWFLSGYATSSKCCSSVDSLRSNFLGNSSVFRSSNGITVENTTEDNGQIFRLVVDLAGEARMCRTRLIILFTWLYKLVQALMNEDT